MLIAKERPGVYWDYDASGVLWGSDSLKQVGIAALCEKGEQNRVYSIRRISDGKAVFGEDSIMAGMIEKALINGASGVKAVKAGTEESFDYEAALAALERENCPSIDRPADTFARLLAGAAGEEPDPVRRRVLAQLLYHLGRWIYLTDAADDLAKDQRSGSYNPLPLRFSMQEGKLTEESRQELAQTMDRSVERMAAAFELLECGVWQPIIESVVYAGLYQVGNAVLNGTFHQRPRREKYPERKAGHGDA